MGVSLNVTLVGEQPLERLLESGAGHPVLAGNDAARGCLTVAEGEQNEALVSVETVPQRLVRIASFF